MEERKAARQRARDEKFSFQTDGETKAQAQHEQAQAAAEKIRQRSQQHQQQQQQQQHQQHQQQQQQQQREEAERRAEDDRSAVAAALQRQASLARKEVWEGKWRVFESRVNTGGLSDIREKDVPFPPFPADAQASSPSVIAVHYLGDVVAPGPVTSRTTERIKMVSRARVV
jgi:hypothetical protein